MRSPARLACGALLFAAAHLLGRAHGDLSLRTVDDVRDALTRAAAAAAASGAQQQQQQQQQGKGAESFKNWIVITSVAPAPTDAVKQWAQLPGWRVVVVADIATPATWAWPNVTLLSVEAQLATGWRTAVQTPFRNYARKNVGYLYAISRGAQTIYETDDDNAPKPGVGLGWADVAGTAVRARATSVERNIPVVNVYEYFGQCRVWPRGYPIGLVLDRNFSWCDPEARVRTDEALSSKSGVLQGLADLDPDVDAAWRLLNPDRIGRMRFEDRPPVALAPFAFSPYNSQNTVHARDAFWALWLPADVGMRVTDIWRSYWAQRLLWDTGQTVAFHAATVDQVRNAHNYTTDFVDELQLYEQAGALVSFLSSWSCGGARARVVVADCCVKLAEDMARHAFWPASHVELVRAWLHDLETVGYAWPNGGAVVPSPPPRGGAAHETPADRAFAATTLFVRATASFLGEATTQLGRSLRLFWPCARSRLVVVLDDEKAKDHEDADAWRAAFDAFARVDVFFEEPDASGKAYRSGHDRQQWTMFHADAYVDTEYVGFVDTDTVFVTAVTPADLFDENGKPYVVAEVGKPENPVWEAMPRGTQLFLGYPEAMRGMSYFPCIFRTDLFPRLRHYITGTHGTELHDVFDAAYALGVLSQFSIFANFAFKTAKKDYHFVLQEYEHGWRGVVDGQVAPAELARLLATEDTAPLARVAVHWGYLTHSNSEDAYRESTLRGACFSGLNHPACGRFNTTAVHAELFEFEQHDWLWDERCAAASARHYQHVRQAGWRFDKEALASIGVVF